MGLPRGHDVMLTHPFSNDPTVATSPALSPCFRARLGRRTTRSPTRRTTPTGPPRASGTSKPRTSTSARGRAPSVPCRD